jgi:glycosyltransferase involved in cell wall biosynthesis
MRVVFVGIQTTELLTFRREMLRAMVSAGHAVLAIAPEEDGEVRAALAAMGVRFATVRLRRAGLNPVSDLTTLASLASTFRRFGPDVVLLSAVKPIAFGAIAARLTGVPMRAAMITGVGSALTGGTGASLRRRLVARLVRVLYRLGLSHVQVAFFQNEDDEALFRDLALIGPRQRVVRIAGSGIDLEEFSVAPQPPPPLTFLMVARLLRDKGLYEYLEAARRVKANHPEVRFQLIGPLDPNPESITLAELARIEAAGIVDYLGVVADIKPYLAAAHVCVLPSYREGTPRSILEGMAVGRAIITTDAPGCRNTLVHGRNGLLVPVRDSDALADAITELVNAPLRVALMGAASRELAEARFDVHDVDRTILTALGLMAPLVPLEEPPELPA